MVGLRPIACNECGKVYEAESRSAPCPRCVAIDLLVPGQDRTDTPVVGIPFSIVPKRKPTSVYRVPDQVDEPPPPIVIPGPPSSLANTMAETRHEEPSPSAPAPTVPVDDFGMKELDRFIEPTPRPAIPAAEPDSLALARIDYTHEDMECPRCAERIKVRARMCRYCQLDLDLTSRPASASPAATPRLMPRLNPLPGRVALSRNQLKRMRARFVQAMPARMVAAADSGSILMIMSISFAVAGLFVFPVIFGAIGIILGLVSCGVEGPKGLIGVASSILSIFLWWVVFFSPVRMF